MAHVPGGEGLSRPLWARSHSGGGGGGKLSSSNYSSLVPIQYALHLTLPLSNYVF